MQEGSIWVTKCCYSYNSMCSCTLGCMPVCWTLFHSHERLVGLCLQLVFRSTCHALTRACPNTGTPCFCTFGPGTRTWPVFVQGGGQGMSARTCGSVCVPMCWCGVLLDGKMSACMRMRFFVCCVVPCVWMITLETSVLPPSKTFRSALFFFCHNRCIEKQKGWGQHDGLRCMREY